MNKTREIEMKNDGHEQKRFRDLLKKVVNVQKDEIKRPEKRNKRETKKKG